MIVKDTRDIINKENLLVIRDLIQKRTGLFFAESKMLELEKPISLNFLKSPVNTFDEYLLRLSSNYDDSYIKNLISLLTTNETYFFRGKMDFEILKKHLLPDLIKRESSNPSISIWSAGCSTGEEAYSVAIILKELLPKIETMKVNIVASDIDEAVLSAAKKGEYSQWSFRGVDTAIINKYFNKKGDAYQIKEDYRSLVQFIHHNLISDPAPANFDIIICRNVTIYFQKETTANLASKFHNSLKEGGYLIVGHTEYSADNYSKFVSRVFPSGIVYQKRTNGAAKNKAASEPIAARITEKKQHKETDGLLNIIKKSGPSQPKPHECLNLYEHRNNYREETMIFNEAIKYYNSGNYDFAVDRFFKVLDINPKNVRASWMLCHISANRGHFEDAVKWGNLCLEIDPLFKEAYYTLSLIHLEKKEYNEAVEKLKKSIYIDPNFTLGYFTLGNIYTLMYLHSQAKDCFKIAGDLLTSKISDEIVFQAEHLTSKELLNLVELKFRTA
jgi:chemotaxis protein methyltransferase CheR